MISFNVNNLSDNVFANSN